MLVATSAGNVLRIPLALFRTESTKAGRRYVKLDDGDKVVMARLVGDEEGVMLATRDARVIHFPVDEVNILAGVGKGVMGIKLDDDDICLGGALIGSRFDALVLETSGGKTHECRRGAYQQVSRGGKGYEVLKRATFTRVVPPPIELVNWDEIDGKGNGKAKHGDGTLFD